MTQDNQGTFARLYDVHNEMNKRAPRSPGRPPNKVQRKPTTVHLTSTEKRHLGQLKLMLDEHFTINQSELVGVAIDTLHAVLQGKGKMTLESGAVKDVASLRQVIFKIVNS